MVNFFAIIERILYILLLLFSFFPYITFGLVRVDSQPNALIVSLMLFVFYCKRKMDIRLFLLLFVLLLSILIYVYSLSFTFNSVRSLMSYVSLFFISYVTFEGLKKANGLSYLVYKLSVCIWFIVGCIQILLYPNFLSFLLPRGDSVGTLISGRGIVCLAPEPTFYGLMCFMFMIVGYINFRERKSIKYVFIILLIQLILFSRSSLCIMSLVFTCVLYLFLIFFHVNFRTKIIFVIYAIIITPFLLFVLFNISNCLNEYRIGVLLNVLLNDPLNFLFVDASVNERFNHLFFSIYGFFSDCFLPHGYDSFDDYMNIMSGNPSFNTFFSDFLYGRENARIMSGVGAILFEIGFWGLLVLYIVCDAFFRLILYDFRVVFFLILFLIVVCIGMPFVTSIIPFAIGNILYLSSNIKTN